MNNSGCHASSLAELFPWRTAVSNIFKNVATARRLVPASCQTESLGASGRQVKRAKKRIRKRKSFQPSYLSRMPTSFTGIQEMRCLTSPHVATNAGWLTVNSFLLRGFSLHPIPYLLFDPLPSLRTLPSNSTRKIWNFYENSLTTPSCDLFSGIHACKTHGCSSRWSYYGIVLK